MHAEGGATSIGAFGLLRSSLAVDTIKLSPVGILDGTPSLYDALQVERACNPEKLPGRTPELDAWSVAILTRWNA